MNKVAWVVPLLLTAACHREAAVHADNASVAEVQAKVGAATRGGSQTFLKPGQWRASLAIDEMSMPDMPREVADRVKSVSAQVHDIDSCLTPEEARHPNSQFWGDHAENCRYEHFDMAGGRIDMTLVCPGNGGGERATSRMHLTGTYGPDDYHIAMDNQVETGVANAMRMKMHIDAKRVADQCAPGTGRSAS